MKGIRRPLCFLCLTYIILIFIVGWWHNKLPPELEKEVVYAPSKETVHLYGRIYKQEVRNENYLIYVTIIAASDNLAVSNAIHSRVKNLLIYSQEQQFFSIGSIVEIRGQLFIPESPSNPGQFNAKSYYNIQDITHIMYGGEVKLQSEHKNPYIEALNHLKNKMKVSLYSIEEPHYAAILEGILLGDRNQISDETSTLYREGGIFHILAISGLHISLLGLCLFKFIRKIGASFFIAGSIAISVMVSYGIMAGASVSTIRALIMFALLMIAQIVGRTYDILSALSLSALLLLMSKPKEIQSVGFLLSFGAVLGICLLTPVLKKILPFQHKIMENMITSFSIQLMTFPIILYFFYEIPLYGIFLNVIVIPVMTILIFSGLFASIAGMFSMVLGGILLGPAHYILVFYEWLCSLFLQLPYAVLNVGQPAIWKIAMYYIGLIIMIFLCVKFEPKKERKDGFKYIIAFLLLMLFFFYSPKNGMTITFLDVGQGDGIFIEMPSGMTYFIDGGSTSKTRVGSYILEPFLKSQGISCIDYAIITHMDQDHMNGILELIEKNPNQGESYITSYIRIKHIMLPKLQEPDEEYIRFINLAKQKGIEVIYMEKGMKFIDEEVTFYCLHPYTTGQKKGKNENSLVLYLDFKEFQGLFTGDVEGTEEIQLNKGLEEYWRGNKAETIEVLKVAHHGSNFSTTEEFLQIVNPLISIISCSSTNNYGHPHPQLIERLENVGTKIYGTVESGAITIWTDGEKMEIQTFKPRLSN